MAHNCMPVSRCQPKPHWAGVRGKPMPAESGQCRGLGNMGKVGRRHFWTGKGQVSRPMCKLWESRKYGQDLAYVLDPKPSPG